MIAGRNTVIRFCTRTLVTYILLIRAFLLSRVRHFTYTKDIFPGNDSLGFPTTFHFNESKLRYFILQRREGTLVGATAYFLC